jgi:hypothetical protein
MHKDTLKDLTRSVDLNIHFVLSVKETHKALLDFRSPDSVAFSYLELILK